MRVDVSHLQRGSSVVFLVFHAERAGLANDVCHVFELFYPERVFELLCGVGLACWGGHIHVVLDAASVEVAVQLHVELPVVVADDRCARDGSGVIAGL